MKKNLLALMIVSVLLLNACQSDNSNTTPTPDANAIYTMAAQTVDAMGTMVAARLQTTVTPPVTVTPAQPILPTVPATPPTEVGLPIAQPAASTALPGSCDKASFVMDVTYPDGTTVPAGTAFTKTWRLMNAGSCTWGAGYKLVYVSGDAMGAASPIALSSVVAPGATVDVSVVMTAPATTAVYTSYWMLQNATGGRFGIGSNGTNSFYVNIVVGGATVTGTPPTSTPGTITPGTPTATLAYFAVRNVILAATPSAYSGTCPVSITTSGSMIASQAGTVTYYYVHSDGKTAIGSSHTLVFSAGGTLTFSDTLSVPSSDTYSVYIDAPNHYNFSGASFIVACVAATSVPTIAPTNTFTPVHTPTPTSTSTPVPTSTHTPTPTNSPTPG